MPSPLKANAPHPSIVGAQQYDAVGNPSKTAYLVTKTDRGTWKERKVTLNDAHFGNRGPQGADLMFINMDTEDDIFHVLELTKGEDDRPNRSQAVKVSFPERMQPR